MISKLKFSFTVFMFISVSPLLWTGLGSLILAMLDWAWISALCSIRTLPETKLSQCKAKPWFFVSHIDAVAPQKNEWKSKCHMKRKWLEYNHGLNFNYYMIRTVIGNRFISVLTYFNNLFYIIWSNHRCLLTQRGVGVITTEHPTDSFSVFMIVTKCTPL